MVRDDKLERRLVRPEKERTLAIDKDVFAHRLWQAIKRSGLTYRETARRAQEFLPPGLRMSDVSVWSYAKGRSLPRRMVYIEALGRVLDLDVAELTGENELAREAPRESGIKVEDLGAGRARLWVNLEAPWATAIEVLNLLREAREAPDPRADQ